MYIDQLDHTIENKAGADLNQVMKFDPFSTVHVRNEGLKFIIRTDRLDSLVAMQGV